MMVQVGVHVSIAGSLDKAVGRAEERGCDCFQIFTKNPRGWAAKEISEESAEQFIQAVRESSLIPPFAHMPYLPNLASEKPDIYQKSVDALISELHRCSTLRIPSLVTHLGHSGDGPISGRTRVIEAIQEALDRDGGETRLLLENTAGERNSVGSSLEEISEIMEIVGDSSRTGVCFDTCHAFAAGYDLRTAGSVDNLLKQVEDLIGMSALFLIHLNDAKGDLGSGKDRHEHIGCGSIGRDGMHALINHPLVRGIPFVCETPVDSRRGDIGNIAIVRELAHNP